MTRVVMIPTTASTPFQNLFSFWTAGAAAASIQTLPLASPIQHNIHAYHNTQTPHKYMYRERKKERGKCLPNCANTTQWTEPERRRSIAGKSRPIIERREDLGSKRKSQGVHESSGGCITLEMGFGLRKQSES